jgi:very-short-patch-repair endonuclease
MYDEQRSRALESYGITVTRFTNEQVFRHADQIIEKTKEILTKASPSGDRGKKL